MALGGNAGIESVTVLTNHLRRMLVNSKGSKPSSAALEEALAAYQAERIERMKHIMKFSSFVNRVQGWSSPFHKIIATWVIPILPQRLLADQMGEIISDAPKLNFVDVGSFPTGLMPFKDKAGVKGKMPKEEHMFSKNRGWLSVITALLIVFYYYYVATVSPLTAHV